MNLVEIGLFYGSTNGDTARVAERIRWLCESPAPPEQPWAHVELLNVADFFLEEMADFQIIMIGAPTWNHGQLQRDWEAIYLEFDALDLSGKIVAFFGLGDQAGYPDTYLDALAFLVDKVIERGGRVVGEWPTDETYFCHQSWALRDGRFAGLALDEVNQADLTEARLRCWLSGLRSELGAILS